jgi:phasin protein
MTNRYQRTGANADPAGDILMAPRIALELWNPFLAGALNGSSISQALGGLGTVAVEWQDFVRRRLTEDAALLERLTRSTTPDQVLAAYGDFWRKAGEDYGSEITTMTKLMADMTNKMAVAAQPATEEASTKLFHREAA